MDSLQYYFKKCLDQGAILQIEENRFLVCGGEVQFLSDPQSPYDFYQPYFYSTHTSLFTHYSEYKFFSRFELLSLALSYSKIPSFDWESPNVEQFQMQYDSLTRELDNARLKKGVPYTFQKTYSTPKPGHIAHMIYSALSATDAKSLHLFGAWNKAGGRLGITPEVLFEYSKNTLKTMALAGTFCEGETVDDKLIYEHKLVVDMLSQALSSFGAVSTGNMEVLSLSTFSHLRTLIEVNVKEGINFRTLADVLHPTPALGGSPQIEALDWLKKIDSSEKRLFGAPFGICQKMVIAIRGVEWYCTASPEIILYAGCGVVKQSIFEKEWEEVKRKLLSIRKGLGI